MGGRRVSALDWPGHGAEPHDGVAPSSTHYAGLLGRHLDRLELSRVVLVGNSIGGATALRFAADHPERVSALVPANPGGLDRRDLLFGFTCRLMSRFSAAGARGAWWYPRLFRAYYEMVLPFAPVERARITERRRAIAPLLRDAWAGFASLSEDLRAHGRGSAARRSSPGPCATASCSSAAAARPSPPSRATRSSGSALATRPSSRRRMPSQTRSRAS
jgi:pimeloyl-ACP methyl ester carboxylesterase